MYVIRRKTMFENYTDSLFNDKIILKSQKKNEKRPSCGAHRRSQ